MKNDKIKIAYLLVVHKCPEQVNCFVNELLEYGECDIYIHVDKKNEKMCEKMIDSPRVHVYSIYDVRWGSFEIVKSAYYLMEQVENSEKEYSHIYFGSGQDLIVKKGLYEFLQKKPNKIFIRINGEITNKDRASARYRICWPKKLMIRNDFHIYRFFRIAIQLLCCIGITTFPNRNKVKKINKFYEGRTWFIAPIEVMHYILSFIKENPDYIKFWECSLASDLMFFQTIIMNSFYADWVEDELMYVNFGKTYGTMNHPLTITKNDWNDIEKSRCFFARKYDEIDVMEYYLNRMSS